MEDLKKTVQQLSAKNAFYIYAGVAVLLLLCFVVFNQVSLSVGPATAGCTGIQLITGKATVSAAGQSITGDAETGFCLVLALLFLISIIGVTALTYMKKVVNFALTIVPVALLFLIAVIGINEGGEHVGGSAMCWIEIIIGAAWVLFAYLRGNQPVSMN